MDQAFIAEIKARLVIEKKELEKELGRVAEKGSNTANHYEATFPDFGEEEEENAAEVGEFTTNLGLEQILTSSLRDVDSALSRIKNQTYGICKYCQKEITPARLQARPSSSACIECKQRLTKEK